MNDVPESSTREGAKNKNDFPPPVGSIPMTWCWRCKVASNICACSGDLKDALAPYSAWTALRREEWTEIW